VPFHKRAWHAGVSQFNGRDRCNDFSVGIELEGTDDRPYTSAQYASLNRLLQGLRDHYPSLRAAPVVGHSDVAPGRKTDPGPSFDWSQLRGCGSREFHPAPTDAPIPAQPQTINPTDD